VVCTGVGEADCSGVDPLAADEDVSRVPEDDPATERAELLEA
jgi:hypothetical protein